MNAIDYERLIDDVVEKRVDPKELSLVTLIQLENFARVQKDIAEENSKRWGVKYDHFSINVVPERMNDDGIKNINVSNIGRVELRPDIWTQTLNPAKLKVWLEEQGLGDIIVPSVNGSTLKALIREQMRKEDGNIPAPEVVKVTPYTRAVIVKG